MSLCTCPERPKCQCRWCEAYADWSMWQPQWRDRPERFKFMCDYHGNEYRKAMTERIPGIDRPEGASDLWRPSLFDMIRQAEIKLNEQDKREGRAPFPTPKAMPSKETPAVRVELEDYSWIRNMPPGQRETLIRLREANARYGLNRG